MEIASKDKKHRKWVLLLLLLLIVFGCGYWTLKNHKGSSNLEGQISGKWVTDSLLLFTKAAEQQTLARYNVLTWTQWEARHPIFLHPIPKTKVFPSPEKIVKKEDSASLNSQKAETQQFLLTLVDSLRQHSEGRVADMNKEKKILLANSCIMVDETRTKGGRDFYDLFVQRWNNMDGQWQKLQVHQTFQITIRELPVRGFTTKLNILIGEDIIYQGFVQQREEYIEQLVEDALQRVRYLLIRKDQMDRELDNKDMKGSGISYLGSISYPKGQYSHSSKYNFLFNKNFTNLKI